MKLFLPAVLCFSFHFCFGQKITAASIEKLLFASASDADSLLRKSGFKTVDKEKGDNYNNYYYTSHQKSD
jgi:hypothetical protein